MQNIIAITIPLALLLASSSDIKAQGTIRLSFDQLPEKPPGYGTTNSPYYPEAGVGVHASGGGFTLRWPGGLLFPHNGTPYLQGGGSERLYFTLGGAGQTFAAVSVDLALYSASSLDPVTVQFRAYGYLGELETIATTEFTVTGVLDSQGRPAFQTFYFPPEFKGMYYLFVTPLGPQWSLDNLVIYVPEPSVLALLLVGGGLLWFGRRRLSGAAEAHGKHDTIH
jgi:hypothetical protein